MGLYGEQPIAEISANAEAAIDSDPERAGRITQAQRLSCLRAPVI